MRTEQDAGAKRPCRDRGDTGFQRHRPGQHAARRKAYKRTGARAVPSAAGDRSTDPSVADPAAKAARLIVRYSAVNDFHPLGKEEMQPVIIKAPFQGKKRHFCAEDEGS